MASNLDELQVKVETPEGVIWEGLAQSVSSRNSAGPFDLLPEHANMITLIENQPIVIVSSAGEQRLNFMKAVISVRDNVVSIHADIFSSEESGSAPKAR